MGKKRERQERQREWLAAYYARQRAAAYEAQNAARGPVKVDPGPLVLPLVDPNKVNLNMATKEWPMPDETSNRTLPLPGEFAYDYWKRTGVPYKPTWDVDQLWQPMQPPSNPPKSVGDTILGQLDGWIKVLEEQRLQIECDLMRARSAKAALSVEAPKDDEFGEVPF
jgi:hypothetical protein